jgi:Helix-turn-helix domain
MITVFNGKSFGLSGERSSGFVQVERLLVDHIKTFTPSGFVVFMALVMHVDDNGYCWPSIKRLVECTGLSETTVKTALHYLTGMRINDKRILAVNPRTSPNGRTTSNGYKLFPDTIDHHGDVTVVTAGSTKTEKAKEEDPAYPLYKTFKQVVSGFNPEAPITDKEWKSVRLTIWEMHKAGVTHDDVKERVKVLLGKWYQNQDMITVRSLWRHWDTHAKPKQIISSVNTTVEGWFDDNNR